MANYLAAKSGAEPMSYTTYNSVIGLPGAWYHSFFWNWFAQDSFQVRPNLLLIFGVRYDRFQGPPADPNAPFTYSRSFRTPAKISRRAWAWPGPSRRRRCSAPAPASSSNPSRPTSGTTRSSTAETRRHTRRPSPPATPLAPAFPNVIALTPGAVPPSADITTITPNFRNAYTINTSIQITRQLPNNDSLTVGYVNTGARELTYLRNLNLINPDRLPGGRPADLFHHAERGDAARSAVQQHHLTGRGRHHGLQRHDRELHSTGVAQGFQVSASYTWSHSISDAPDANSFEQNLFIEDNTNRTRDRGNSIVNRPQALTLSACHLPDGDLGNRHLEMAGQQQRPGAAGQLLLGRPAEHHGQPQPEQRCQGCHAAACSSAATRVRGPNIYQFDARYTRTFFTLWERLKPKFIAEVNNLFNRENITALNTAVPVDSLGVAQLPSSFAALEHGAGEADCTVRVRVDW